MRAIVWVLALTLVGVITGAQVAMLLFYSRATSLSKAAFIEMRHSLDPMVVRVASPVGIVALLALAGAGVLNWNRPPANFLIALTLACTAISGALGIRYNLPITRQIANWTDETIPAEWAAVQDRWTSVYRIRTATMVLAFLLLNGAVLTRP